MIDLHPSGLQASYVFGVSGTSQVGWGRGPALGPPGTYHALLWKSTPSSVVDLHPPGFDVTIANGVSGMTQVGSGFGVATQGDPHALLWYGTATSIIDLHPSGFVNSSAEAAAGIWQVGSGNGPVTGGNDHALVWRGAADTVVDLHSSLDQTGLSFSLSLATGVNENGDIVGWGDTADGRYAIKWSLVPEPTTQVLLLVGALALLSGRRHHAVNSCLRDTYRDSTHLETVWLGVPKAPQRRVSDLR